jgi:hypothetical protein
MGGLRAHEHHDELEKARGVLAKMRRGLDLRPLLPDIQRGKPPTLRVTQQS